MGKYVYLGDRLTDPRLVGQPCDPIRRADAIHDTYRHHPWRCARCGGVRRSSKSDYQPHCDWCDAALARQAAKAGVVYVQGALL